MLGTLLWLAGVAALGWLALVAFLVLQERRLIFFPARALAAAPADYGLAAEELAIRTADGVMLHGWWIDGPGDRVLIWYHGNAGNIGDRLHDARWFVDRLGVSVVLVDYRGYGRSGGSPDEAGVYADGLAVYDAVAARAVRPERIVLFGRSLGGAVALEVALHRRAGAIALESVFRSVRALAREHYPFVPGSLVRTRMDNVSKIGRVGAPVLVLHGDRDSIVPLAHGRELLARAAGPARLHVIAGAGHNDTYLVGGEPYAEAWRAFLRETIRAAGTGAGADAGAGAARERVTATGVPRNDPDSRGAEPGGSRLPR